MLYITYIYLYKQLDGLGGNIRIFPPSECHVRTLVSAEIFIFTKVSSSLNVRIHVEKN